MKELKDTIELMMSADYKDRFKAEYYQTKIRYEKLKHFCNKIEAARMLNDDEPAHDCPLSLLRDQQRCMGFILSVLEKRAIMENIDLEEV